jgi:lipopolysaccharide/colanic/teichoic acid biosynthesis glycosyltransferase
MMLRSSSRSLEGLLDAADFLASVFPERRWFETKNEDHVLSPAAYARAKRALDIALSLAAMPFALLALALCAIAIKLDSPGPIGFTQLRTGKGGRRFKMFKLRTMVRNAEELKAKYMHLNELTYPDFKISNDPRITRVGRFLRKTSLDELPQIFNVLKGDMSLVGPRPTSFSADTYRLWHTARLESKPGITGLWQVSGRNELDFDERLRLDIAYHRNQSLSLDLRILLRTVGSVLNGRGAN